MVNGVEMVFSKQKMIDRLTAEGRASDIDGEALTIMDNLDGQPVSTASWSREVRGEPVYSCFSKDGRHYDVNENDCMTKAEFDAS